jgi:transcriptional regulator with XRE-family HTH domain
MAAVGDLLRDWRRRRRLSQLDLALEAGVSARHLSFLETGRSQPSRAMVLRLARELEVPLRERNRMLLAAGYAPAYGERTIDAPEMTPVREAIDTVLRAHEPFPALVIDRWWDLVAANGAVAPLMEGVPEELFPNVLRISLHPDGLAPRIENLAEWRAHLLGRLRRELVVTADPRLAALLDEAEGYPGGELATSEHAIAVPLRLGGLSFLSTVATFGTAVDVTVAELSIEAFLPADERTAAQLVSDRPSPGTPG